MNSAEVTAVRHLTAEQLAVRLSMPLYSIYQLVRAGKLPCLRIGRRVRFPVAAIEAWEAAGGSPVKSKPSRSKKK